MTKIFSQFGEGYTKIPNNILKALYKLPLNGTEIRLIIFVTRMTRGWNKESKPISYGYITKETNLNKRNVRRAVSLLSQAKVIIKNKDGRRNVLSINSDCASWELWRTHGNKRAKLPLYKG